MRRYRIVNRKRFITFTVIMILIGVLFADYLFGIAAAALDNETGYLEYEVCSGDTLWNIAETYMGQTDTRKAVYELCRLNDISADELNCGMTIMIPFENA